mgnify:CR=1 FL=1
MFEALMIVEDDAQEAFLKRLVERLACELGVPLALRVRSAQGGSGRVLTHLKSYTASWKAGKEGCENDWINQYAGQGAASAE